jgi:hemerythrin superfamily protein
MEHLDRRNALKALAGTAGLTALPDSAAWAGEPGQPKPDRGKQMEIKIPASLKAEHEELHEELVRLTKAGGKTGEAAQAVAKVLHPHFVKEEELAMPPLGLLRPLAEGGVRPEMAKVVELTDKLKKDMPTMLKEHEAIVGTLQALAEAGKQENKPQAQQFADKLTEHAKTEEDVLYPAAILVGEYVKLKLNK